MSVSLSLTLLSSTYSQLGVQSDDSGRRKAQAEAVRKREPVPELAEESHADNRRHVRGSSLGLQRNRDISASGIDDSL